MVTKKDYFGSGKTGIWCVRFEKKNEKQHEHQEQLASSPTRARVRFTRGFLWLFCLWLARCQVPDSQVAQSGGKPDQTRVVVQRKKEESRESVALAQVLEKKGSARNINPILPLSESEERSSAQVFTSIGLKLRSSSHSGRKYDRPSNQLEWLESNILDCVEVKPSSFWPEGPKNKIYPCSEKTNLHHWLI